MMSKTKLIFTISFLLLATLACNALALPTTPAPQPPPTTIVEILETPTEGSIPLTEADVPRVKAEEAKLAMDGGGAIIVDVRSKEAFAASHIAGSINIPLTEFETNPAGINLQKDQWIITYCT
ncbi:MAG: rhodanese-like domain-containing protein [Anaerolineales bacterium]